MSDIYPLHTSSDCSGVIYHSESGKGFPIVLVHGFCETHHIWNSFQEQLSQHFRILCPDLPGINNSPVRTDEFSLDDIADCLYEWLNELAIKTCVIIGHSLGGYITLSFARRHSELLAGFGLFHSTALADPDQKKDTRNKAITFIREHTVFAFISSFFPLLFFEKNLATEKVRIAMNKAIKKGTSLDSEVIINYIKAMRDRKDQTEVLRAFKDPMLIIAGEEDTSVPIKDSIEQAQLSKMIEFCSLKDTGHMGMFEKETETIKAIKTFAEKCIRHRSNS